MKIIRGLKAEKGLGGSAITLGVYDGVHLGHKKIISEVVSEAAKTGLPSAAVTFTPHPSRVLSGKPTGLITEEAQKLKILENCGLDYCVILNFTESLARKSAEDFAVNIIADFMKAKSVTVGFNHAFGEGRKGNSDLLGALGKTYGFSLRLVDPVKINGETVSSSKIRKFIGEGYMEKANLFLGRAFSIGGKVKKGSGEGDRLGFPTANIEQPPGIIEPAPGVYAGHCFLEKKPMPAVFYCGNKPTFGGTPGKSSMEIHIMGFSGNVYGKIIRFGFARRLRPDIKFPDRDSLKRKIACDIKTASELLRE